MRRGKRLCFIAASHLASTSADGVVCVCGRSCRPCRHIKQRSLDVTRGQGRGAKIYSPTRTNQTTTRDGPDELGTRPMHVISRDNRAMWRNSRLLFVYKETQSVFVFFDGSFSERLFFFFFLFPLMASAWGETF